MVNNAEGDAARFKQVVGEYQKAPAVTRDRMYLDTMQQIFSNNTKVLVDTKSGSNMLYLPLDKLVTPSIGNGDAGKLPSAGPSMAPNSVTGVPSDAGTSSERSRDPRSRETRDRESR